MLNKLSSYGFPLVPYDYSKILKQEYFQQIFKRVISLALETQSTSIPFIFWIIEKFTGFIRSDNSVQKFHIQIDMNNVMEMFL